MLKKLLSEQVAHLETLFADTLELAEEIVATLRLPLNHTALETLQGRIALWQQIHRWLERLRNIKEKELDDATTDSSGR